VEQRPDRVEGNESWRAQLTLANDPVAPSVVRFDVPRVFTRALFNVALLLPAIDQFAAGIAAFFLGIPRCLPPLLPDVPRSLAIFSPFRALGLRITLDRRDQYGTQGKGTEPDSNPKNLSAMHLLPPRPEPSATA
jgi:hypothetical protein